MAVRKPTFPVHYRIGPIMEFLILATSIILECLQFLLSLTGVGEIVSEFLSFAGDGLFFIWLFFLGVKYMGRNATLKLGITLITAVVEFIPFVNDLPTFTVGIWYLVRLTRKEDYEDAEKLAKKREAELAEKAQAAARAQQEAAATIRQRQQERDTEEDV